MITQTNAFVVVLDTCVLAPMPLCDTLLRLAEDPAFYIPRWSAGILDELRRVLCRMQYSGAQAERRITAMQTAFEDACVTGYSDLVASMINEEKDGHVLAAAVRTGAHAILTENVKQVTLMRYLCRLVTPPGGIILDPFAGTGATGEAAVLEGFCPIMIELEIGIRLGHQTANGRNHENWRKPELPV